jgi:hypothetical protein
MSDIETRIAALEAKLCSQRKLTIVAVVGTLTLGALLGAAGYRGFADEVRTKSLVLVDDGNKEVASWRYYPKTQDTMILMNSGDGFNRWIISSTGITALNKDGTSVLKLEPGRRISLSDESGVNLVELEAPFGGDGTLHLFGRGQKHRTLTVE